MAASRTAAFLRRGQGPAARPSSATAPRALWACQPARLRHRARRPRRSRRIDLGWRRQTRPATNRGCRRHRHDCGYPSDELTRWGEHDRFAWRQHQPCRPPSSRRLEVRPASRSEVSYNYPSTPRRLLRTCTNNAPAVHRDVADLLSTGSRRAKAATDRVGYHCYSTRSADHCQGEDISATATAGPQRKR